LLRRDGGRDRLPLGGDPAAIDFEKNLKLVGEVHIGGAGRVAHRPGDAVGIGAEANAVEQLAGSLLSTGTSEALGYRLC